MAAHELYNSIGTKIPKEPAFSNMYGLSDIGSRSNLTNMEKHQSVLKCDLNLVLKFTYLTDLVNMVMFNISGLDGVK